jgi:type IV secretory pathway VirB9-like protein
VASRFISIKPKLANTTTDIHIVSDHGNEYTLQLQEISGDADAHFDSKVFILPGDKAAKDRLTDMPVFVPAAELDKAKQEAAAAKAAQAAELKSEEAKAETYRSQYPGSLHFDFTWDEKKGKELGLQQIWHDDKFTYLRGQFQETPALYELKDGKGSLINFDYNGGLYTVPKQLETGYLAIGKKRVDFHRSEEKN